MRALIRADLKPAEHWVNLWNGNDNGKYDQEVVKLFTQMGYAPVETGHRALHRNKFVRELIDDMPKDIKEQETKHLIMLGYTSEGQSHFLVTGVNPTEIHIRIKGRLLGRLTKSCVHIHENSLKFRHNQTRVRRWLRRLQRITGIEPGPDSPCLILRPKIEVMEPTRDHPTIIGEMIESARSEVIQNSPHEIILVVFALIAAMILFLFAPDIAPRMQNSLTSLGVVFDVDYIQGALERIYSAFLVTAAVTILALLTRIFELRRQKPIRWSDVGTKERL